MDSLAANADGDPSLYGLTCSIVLPKFICLFLYLTCSIYLLPLGGTVLQGSGPPIVVVNMCMSPPSPRAEFWKDLLQAINLSSASISFLLLLPAHSPPNRFWGLSTMPQSPQLIPSYGEHQIRLDVHMSELTCSVLFPNLLV